MVTAIEVDGCGFLLQCQLILWMPIWQLVLVPTLGCLGKTNDTFLAPPHLVLVTVVPDVEQS